MGTEKKHPDKRATLDAKYDKKKEKELSQSYDDDKVAVARACAREGCGYAVTWHPTHCCAMCVSHGKHGGRCERKAFVCAPSSKLDTELGKITTKEKLVQISKMEGVAPIGNTKMRREGLEDAESLQEREKAAKKGNEDKQFEKEAKQQEAKDKNKADKDLNDAQKNETDEKKENDKKGNSDELDDGADEG